MNPSNAPDAPEPIWRPPKQTSPVSPISEIESDANADADTDDGRFIARLYAEYAMAEITPREWVDLRAIKATRYELGHYETRPSPADDPQPCVRLTWMPGRILLSETLRIDPESALSLPLPSVRHSLEVQVPHLHRGRFQARRHSNPSRSNGCIRTRPRSASSRCTIRRGGEYVRPQKEAALQMGMALLAETQDDEQTLAYRAMQDIQARRMEPTEGPPETISAALETLAERLRTASSL